jgi:adenine-specific DNA-methyltransferase
MSRNYDHLSREELLGLLQARDKRDATRFGLVWEANEIEREKAINGDFVALDLDPTLSCGEGPWQNLIIEGDNFDALRALNMSFKGQVKCIYIDPPYNTGNKDFVYNDHFVEKEDLWRHSTWCEFMYQRLTLAKDLLREDGAIFVSIDDNELFSLGLLMDKVFGEKNHVANIVWQSRYSRSSDASFSVSHNFILAFANDPELWKKTRNKLERTEKQAAQYKNLDDDPRGPWRAIPWDAPGVRPNLEYPIKTLGGSVKLPPPGRHWSRTEDQWEEIVKAGLAYFGKSGDGAPAFKQYLSEAAAIVPNTWWPHEEAGHTDDAKKELQAIFGNNPPFDTPKPTRLIDRILQIATNPGDLVLDFFAGSGTTAHSVLKANKADGGNRRFILVSSTEATQEQLDKNLCRDVCAERVRRVSQGYRNAKGEEVEGLGGDFAYLRCRKIPSGELLEIRHEQVWTALQLIHRPTLAPYEEAQYLVAEDAEGALIYVPSFRKDLLPDLRETVSRHASVIIYSWQPGLLRQHLRAPHVQHEAIPESLIRRFGLKR